MDPGPLGPQSYTARGEKPSDPEGDYVRSTDDAVMGAEWVYVLCKGGIRVWEGDMGAFGCGGGNFRDPVMVPWGDLPAMLAIEGAED